MGSSEKIIEKKKIGRQSGAKNFLQDGKKENLKMKAAGDIENSNLTEVLKINEIIVDLFQKKYFNRNN